MGGLGGQFDDDFLTGGRRRPKRRTRHEKKMERFGAEGASPRFEHVPLEANVTVRAPVFATEDRERVELAARALFPDVRFDPDRADGAVEGQARTLERLAEVIRSSRIRDSAREVLRDALGADGALRVELNKQAAAAGHVNFALKRGEALGTLVVEIRAERPRALIEELTWIEGESDERLLGTKVKASARPVRSRGGDRAGR
jgi:predicted RNA binding protein with dsRBD fold (UPF0201 family)